MRDHSDGASPAPAAAIGLAPRRPPARPRRGRRTWAIAAAGLAVAAALIGGVRYGVAVETIPYLAAAQPFPVTLKGPGALEALRTTALGATVQGRLAAIWYDIGDPVRAGAPVAGLEDHHAQIDLEKAIEQARAAQALIEEAKAQRRREQALLDRAARELKRQRTLRARGVASDGAYELAEADHAAAEAKHAEAEARVRRLTAELGVALRTVELRREALAETVIVAPFAGVVTARAHEIGDVVAPGTPIVELVDRASLVLTARFDESLMARVAVGQPAVVRFESEPGRAYPAQVFRINPKVDPETREFAVDLSLTARPKNWALGQRGAAEIRVETKTGALAAPRSYVKRRGGGYGVWVADRGRARWRPVTLGAASGGRVEVRAGLEPGAVLLDGPRLFPGARVATDVRPAP